MTVPHYEDARVTLFRGDALAVLQNLGTATVDAVICDPPYSSGGMVRGDRTAGTASKYMDADAIAVQSDFTCDNRDQRAYAYWSALWMGEALRATRSGGLMLAFTDWRQLPATTDAIQAGGWIWRGIIPWYKPQVRPQLGRFSHNCEYVVWGSNGVMPMDYKAGGVIFPGFYQAQPPREREHQTQKPLEIMRQMMQIVPNDGVVLDPFMGSGTTGVAAVLEGRRFIGVELIEEFVRTSQRRMQEAQLMAVTRLQGQAVFDFSDVEEPA